MKALAVLAQLDPAAVAALERIATAQIVIAVIMTVIGLLIVGGGVLVLLEMRRARRLLHRTLGEVEPRLGPLIDRAKHVTNDVAGMTDNIRRKVDDILHTAEDVNRAVKRGHTATEERVRSFGAVLDVVQAETEELLLDAAATAHGVHETARVLREPRAGRSRQPAGPTDVPGNENEEGTT
jgi:methyl-accepting chemotaxis protein